MALTSRQRAALPDSAFAYPAARKYPVPTKAQAQRAGISEAQRLAVHRNAVSRAAQRGTRGTYVHVAKAVKKRSGAKVAAVGGAKGTVYSPGPKGKRTRK